MYKNTNVVDTNVEDQKCKILKIFFVCIFVGTRASKY